MGNYLWGKNTATSITSDNKYTSMENTQRLEVATFAAGCFWDVEAEFRRVEGVIFTTVGYTGGTMPDPTYEQVVSGNTGHVEAVCVEFDPGVVTYERLLDVFFRIHDPTRSFIEKNYRTAIFYHSEKQKKSAEAFRDRLMKSGRYREKIVTEIVPASKFWKAEEYHQQFYEKSGHGYSAIPKYYE